MNYELAKQLKDAGFRFVRGDVNPYQTFQLDADTYREPTLSELIEACGANFNALSHIRRDGLPIASMMGNDRDMIWIATCHEKTVIGKTPEETVAKLWLSLNKKE